MSAEDFRSDPSDSPEGKGRARAAWDAYVRAVEPAARPLATAAARNITMEMVGFWVCWHAFGGFEGLEQRMGMHRSTIWRKVAKFRRTFGAHPDEFEFPGLKLDPERFWSAAALTSDDPSQAE